MKESSKLLKVLFFGFALCCTGFSASAQTATVINDLNCNVGLTLLGKDGACNNITQGVSAAPGVTVYSPTSARLVFRTGAHMTVVGTYGTGGVYVRDCTSSTCPCPYGINNSVVIPDMACGNPVAVTVYIDLTVVGADCTIHIHY